jgi:3-hydroxyacyl-[acyl-carrier-protein] dehydratase
MRFLLVDGIADVEDDAHIRGWKNAAMSEDYFTHHFPERPIVPGMLLLEACVQLAGWLEAASSDFRSWVLLETVRTARYDAFAVPGDRIDLHVERLPCEDSERRVQVATTSVGGARGARLEFGARVVSLSDLMSPDTARRMYATLRGESA